MGATRMRTIDWVPGPRAGHIRLIDQTRLPGSLVELRIRDGRRAGRRDPASGRQGRARARRGGRLRRRARPRHPDDDAAVRPVARLRAARPTAVNLASGRRPGLAASRAGGPDGALVEAERIRDEDIAARRSIATRGVDLVAELVASGAADRDDHLQHGRTGRRWNAGRRWASARQLHARRDLEGSAACETRPLLQGARLTAWELDRMGALPSCLVDGAAARSSRAAGWTSSLSGPTGSPGTATRPTRSAALALACGAGTPACRSWWSHLSRPWTQPPRPEGPSIEERTRRGDRLPRRQDGARRSRAPSTRPSTSRRPRSSPPS